MRRISAGKNRKEVQNHRHRFARADKRNFGYQKDC